jgi:hypothetical protein
MKYVVQVKYTNPAHEHVSLRRRVETVNRLVEAATEQEAINRVANQQRALGFMVKEAKVEYNGGQMNGLVANNDKEPKNKKIVGNEDEETEIKKEPVKEAVKSGNEGRGYHGEHDAEVADKKYAEAHANVMKVVGNASSKMVKDYLDSRHGRHLVGREGNHEHIRTDFDKFKKEYNPKMFEDAEQTDEAKKWSRAEWRMGTETDVDKNNKKIYDKLSATDPAKAKAFHDNLMRMKKNDVKEEAELDETARDWKRAFGAVAQKNLQKDIGAIRSKVSRHNYIGMQPAVHEPDTRTAKVTKKGTYSEEVEQIEEDRPMSAPAYSSVSSKILTGKTDTNFGYAPNKMPPHLKAAQAKSDALSKDEKKPQAGTLAAKSRKAAEKMVNLAKGKANQINLEPSVDPHRVPGMIGAIK